MTFRTTVLVAMLAIGPHAEALAQHAASEDDSRGVQASPLPINAPIAAVTLYRGRAIVTRSAALQLQSGAYDLRFTNLPPTVVADSLQARTDRGLRVLSVDFVQEAAADVAASPHIAELDEEIKGLSQALRAMHNQRALIVSQEEFLAALTIRTTAEGSNASGTPAIDLEAIRKQMAFITAERKRLNSERAALDTEQPAVEARLAAAQQNRQAAAAAASSTRTAIVSVVAPDAFSGDIALSYLVTDATWQAAYNIRAREDFSAAQIEYDALIAQRTGEDWNEVRLTLSTAQPMVAANPPVLSPWYVDIARSDRDFSRAPASVAAPAPGADEQMERLRAGMLDKAELEALAADASVVGQGPSVTFVLPRTVTIDSNSERQQRTRIAVIDSPAEFVHVATPVLTEDVYVRGELVNGSAYQILPGRVAIFVGQDYVGGTAVPPVAPSGHFQMHFGIDPAVTARRSIVSKTTESTGLLSGGRRTAMSYRIAISNGAGRALNLELWDRIPVSRNEDIQVQMHDLSTPLATDSYYTSEQQPQGLLKWWLSVPPNPASSRDDAMVITYSVRIDRAKDIVMTPLPD